MRDTGWESSAPGWIASMGTSGDKGRRLVLDAPMLAHARASGATRALDVGCGEGRFCRALRHEGIDATGLDPTYALLAHARSLDPDGTYLDGRAEALPVSDAEFGLVVSYLSLIDIADHRAAIAEMARVLAPGGTLLVANLAPHVTATPDNFPEGHGGWVMKGDTRLYYAIDNYMTERSYWTAWGDIRIVNHHRPLSSYMAAFLGAGLTLTTYDEPLCTDPGEPVAARYARVPWFNLMVWTKHRKDP